jgi:hypothetical protein
MTTDTPTGKSQELSNSENIVAKECFLRLSDLAEFA